MAIASNIQDLVKELTPAAGTKPKTYTAEVSHTDEEGIVWVRLPGAEQDTPTASTSSEVKMGDTVTVEWRNNKLYIAGNYTNPSAGVERVSKVEQTAEKAMSDAETAQAAANSAQETANAAITIAGDTDQHFWFTETGTDTGAHITEATQEDFLADPTNGGGNLLARSNGIAVRDGLAELASFSASGSQIGQISGAHTSIGANGMQVYKDATTQLANIGYGEGQAETGTAEAPYYSMGVRNATGASDIGNYSMSEGLYTKASGSRSHAEGNRCEASGFASHAEGDSTIASGSEAHSEGDYTIASGDHSHAEGWYTIANHASQHVFGAFNIEDPSDKPANRRGDYIEIVGNGLGANARGNARTLDWAGNEMLAGDLTVGGHSSPIGDIRVRGMQNDTVVHTATSTALCGLTLPAGSWSLVGFVRFPSNNTGVRRANIATTRAANDIFVQESPTQGGVTQLQVCNVVTVTDTTTFYLNVYHTAGVDLTLPAGTSEGYINGIRAVRIA